MEECTGKSGGIRSCRQCVFELVLIQGIRLRDLDSDVIIIDLMK